MGGEATTHAPMYVLHNKSGSAVFYTQKGMLALGGLRLLKAKESVPVTLLGNTLVPCLTDAPPAFEDPHGKREVDIFVKNGGESECVMTLNVERIDRTVSTDSKFVATTVFRGFSKVGGQRAGFGFGDDASSGLHDMRQC